MKTRTLGVELGADRYDIQIGTGNLSTVSEQLTPLDASRLFVLYDENVAVHLQQLQQALPATAEIHTLKIPAGEPSKSIEMAHQAWDFLSTHHADRSSLVIALGGGVVGDLAGFVAATYARGIRFLQIPTTLLSQVDSSVGGKTGINLASAKNMVGAFWQPAAVMIDTNTLSTLDEREFVSGFGEVVKYGLIMDADFLSELETHCDQLLARDSEVLINTIAHCCQLKAQVVEEDEKETSGRRAILNYGHTFAHGFEKVFGYGRFLHGEAVSVGMMCAGALARRLGMVDQAFCDRQETLLRRFKLADSVPPTDLDQLLEVMQGDKKNVGRSIRFILPTAVGEMVLTDNPIDSELVKDSIREFTDKA